MLKAPGGFLIASGALVIWADYFKSNNE